VSNPWKLTPREVETLDKIIALGAEKGAAYELGISPKTVHTLFDRARKRIGSRTRLLAVLEFDRWRRAA
jgi:DNA-binding CsgD family transcriptional regulator